jgi:hypothetical protein
MFWATEFKRVPHELLVRQDQQKMISDLLAAMQLLYKISF